MSKNKNQFIEQIKEIIKEEIRRSLLQQNFSNTWTRVKRRLMCMGYNYEYLNKKFSKAENQTILSYFKNCLYRSILLEIIYGRLKKPTCGKTTVAGIGHFRDKIESFYNKRFDDVMVQVQEENIELESQMCEMLDKMRYVNKYKINEDKVATVYKGNIIKNLIMDCQSYTKYRPNETTGGIFVSWRRKEELPTGA